MLCGEVPRKLASAMRVHCTLKVDGDRKVARRDETDVTNGIACQWSDSAH